MTPTSAKERPILFSGPMVRAILSGQKTVTRRVIKPQPAEGSVICRIDDAPGWWECCPLAEFGGVMPNVSRGEIRCPYGKSRDWLWVRETWRRPNNNADTPVRKGQRIAYRASWGWHDGFGDPWRSSIHMPRWASRINLHIASVRAERLQEMTYAEVYAEGIECPNPNQKFDGDSFDAFTVCEDAFAKFRELWDKLNAKRGYSWESNPWVWRVEFRKVCA